MASPGSDAMSYALATTIEALHHSSPTISACSRRCAASNAAPPVSRGWARRCGRSTTRFVWAEAVDARFRAESGRRPSSPDAVGKPPRLAEYFPGPVWSQGPLPLHITEYVSDRLHNRRPDLRRFYDLFHHRMLSLLYRAWGDTPNRPSTPTGRKTIASLTYVASLMGMGLARRCVAAMGFRITRGCTTSGICAPVALPRKGLIGAPGGFLSTCRCSSSSSLATGC